MKNTYLILNLLLFSLILQSHLTACGLYAPLARYLNVSESEVPKLLSNQKILTEGNRILTPLLNSSIFGGSYTDIKTNKININIVDMSKQGIITNNTAMKPYLNLLLFVQVNNSFDQLNSTFDQLNILSKQYNATNYTLGIESYVNNIVIYLSHADDARNQEFIDHAKKLTPPPIIEYPGDNKKEVVFNSFNSSNLMPRQTSNLRLLGGDGITDFHTVCSAGFWVRSAGREFLATAGHCAQRTNDKFNNMPSVGQDYTFIGQMIIRDIEGFDRGYIMKTNSKVLATPMIRDRDNDDYPELEIMAVTDPDTEGMPICKSGFTTGVTCGRILGITDTLTREQDGLVFHDVIITNMECTGGDSGGPVYVYLDELLPTVMIVGLVYAAGGGLCLFHPVNSILLPGMEVITF